MSKQLGTYAGYIAKSRYARYLDEENRREHWYETVKRYFDFMTTHLATKHQYTLSPHLRNRLEEAVLKTEIMPSMRALMTAGPALERQNIGGYNCAYLPVDDPKSFDEAMYILLNGTGVGFSVEQKYVSKLPEIPDTLFQSQTIIVVRDSKEGWAKALRQLIALLYAGEIPNWDVTQVRPTGARLKTFGGRASGPGPLVDMFSFVVSKFKTAVNRKLTSLEVHDIMCKIGEVVVVGGVRRCLPGDALVQVAPDQWKEMQKMTDEDQIYLDGEYQNVLNVFDQGIQHVMKIELDDGTYLESTENHRWLVFNKETEELEWVMTKDLQDIHGMIDPN